MKTIIFLVVTLLLINGSLLGQINNFNIIDSDLTSSPQRRIPNLKLPKLPEIPLLKNHERFRFQEDFAIAVDSLKLYSDYTVVEEFPGSSRYYAKWPNLSFFPYEKSFIIKPDSTLKYYLIIKDPTLHPGTK